jgi:hypothetical protein
MMLNYFDEIGLESSFNPAAHYHSIMDKFPQPCWKFHTSAEIEPMPFCLNDQTKAG